MADAIEECKALTWRLTGRTLECDATREARFAKVQEEKTAWERELDNQSFAEIARAMGAEGITVDRLEDVGPALKRAIDLQMNHGKTCIIEIMCTRELRAALRATHEGTARIVLVGNRNAIEATAEREGIDLTSMALVDPARSPLTAAFIVDPDAEELSEIAMAAADSARNLLMEEPRLAMLSFSTSGSAKRAAVDKVVAAAERVKARRPGLAIDGDVQLDAAIVAEIANRKLPESQVKGRANVLVFPNLEAGNIGYKLAERVGGAVAIGVPCCRGSPSRRTTCRAAAAPTTFST